MQTVAFYKYSFNPGNNVDIRQKWKKSRAI